MKKTNPIAQAAGHFRCCSFLIAVLAILSPYTGCAQSSIEVMRDPWGIPHIFAKTDAEAFYGLGYATAEDRGFQMTYSLRIIQGRLSEAVGEVRMLNRNDTSVDHDRNQDWQEILPSDLMPGVMNPSAGYTGVVGSRPAASSSALTPKSRGAGRSIDEVIRPDFRSGSTVTFPASFDPCGILPAQNRKDSQRLRYHNTIQYFELFNQTGRLKHFKGWSDPQFFGNSGIDNQFALFVGCQGNL